MNLRTELLKEHSKTQAVRIADYIGSDSDKFALLMQLFLSDDYRVTQRASWVVSHCADRYPHLIQPYLSQLIANLRNNVHVAVRRNTVRILQDISIPDQLIGETADICFQFLESRDEPVAVKVFAMTILGNICDKIPELKNELALIIEDQLPYASAGYKSRAKKVLKKIRN